MRFLYPGAADDPAFGVLASPDHEGAAAGVKAGRPWAGDLGVVAGPEFVKLYEPARAGAWLAEMEPYRSTCLFVTVPDLWGQAAATLEAWNIYAPRFEGWPRAFVAQDGSEDLPLPAGAAALFVGGSDEWRATRAPSVIRRAQGLGWHIHIGRVNWWKRYRYFRLMPGSDSWTCDGTRPRYVGRERTLRAWRKYQAQLPLRFE